MMLARPNYACFAASFTGKFDPKIEQNWTLNERFLSAVHSASATGDNAASCCSALGRD
ncbi:hypothetical protein MPLA_1390008 [Mesorhizobium sp. ORS 3359]|nr:hypothetical protein MPLA_1390008 [Mesorhizobium sp. ORS 3359]